MPPSRTEPGRNPAPLPRGAVNRAYAEIRGLLEDARNRAWGAVNSIMVRAYWHIGRVIATREQGGRARADYGRRLIEHLSERLRRDYGQGFDPSNLWNMRAFYRAYPILDAVRRELTWSHYRLLLRVDKPEARAFYEAETLNARWSTRELERQISSLLFERLALSRDKAGVRALAKRGHEIAKPADLVKDPYVLEFAGLRQDERFLESDLEKALLDKLQRFLLELGKGFAFMARQQRITLDGTHYYIDLVFYNRLTRSHVLLDLKVGKLTHQDLGQMQMYVNYYERERTAPGENPPIGVILCADKDDAVVRYTLPEGDRRIFASRYKLHLPTEAELARELTAERRALEAARRLPAPRRPGSKHS
jgi:predicted nuclease of restriction endonuclease-like (RecB) superfamily